MENDIETIDLQKVDQTKAGGPLGVTICRLEVERLLEPNHEIRNLLDDAYNLCFIARRVYGRACRIKRQEEKRNEVKP